MLELKKFTITDEEFNKLRKLVFQLAGISLSDSKRELVISRFSRRLRTLNLTTFSEYYDFLNSPAGSSEIQNFINSITTNKTDFFREKHHFEFLVQKFIPQILSEKKSLVNIWSAGCSTGEEPYTIAMVMHNNLVEKYGINVKILATDIDTNVLENASRGIYHERVLEPVPEEMLRKYFLKGKDENSGYFKVKDILREMITFKQLNFISENYGINNQFDVVFCRNVIIYFNAETKSYVLNKINSYIRTGGYFIIGHSETMFDMVPGLTYLNNTIYRKDI